MRLATLVQAGLLFALASGVPTIAEASEPSAAAGTGTTKKKSTKSKPKSKPTKPATKPSTPKPAPKPEATPAQRPDLGVPQRPAATPPKPDARPSAPPAREPAKAPPKTGPAPAERSAARPEKATHAVPASRTPPPTRTVSDGSREARLAALHHSADHRYARPHAAHVPAHPHAHHPPPAWGWYRPWYTHWYVHPYWRWTHATVVIVWLPWPVDPWVEVWVPPARAGWAWVPGHWEYGWWVPGHWVPVAPAPVYASIRYTYVPGWWVRGVYVEGYYRAEDRDGWAWVDGTYLEDGTYVWGYWRPLGDGPEGYVWEHGFWDGEQWIEGFWRPELREGHRWVSAWYDDDGVYHAGYWEPIEARSGHVWIPGWFDGEQWIDGYWVADDEYRAADPQTWTPEPGWDAGRTEPVAAPDDAPLAIPVGDSA